MDRLEDFLKVLEPLVIIAAIIIGGIWTYLLFIKNREQFPKADIAHIMDKVRIDDEVLIRLTIEIKNLGKVKLPIESGEVRLQQIKPLSENISSAIESFKENKTENKSDIGWPLLDKRILKYAKEKPYELEPGEKEHFEFDFIVDQEIETVQFYTHIENTFKENVGWNYTSIHELK